MRQLAGLPASPPACFFLVPTFVRTDESSVHTSAWAKVLMGLQTSMLQPSLQNLEICFGQAAVIMNTPCKGLGLWSLEGAGLVVFRLSFQVGRCSLRLLFPSERVRFPSELLSSRGRFGV